MNRSPLFLFSAVVAIALGVASFRSASQAEHEASDTVPVEAIALPPLKKATGQPRPHLERTEPTEGVFSRFDTLVRETLDSLPTADDIRKNPDADVHFTPPEIFAVAPSLGQIATRLRESPELIPQGIEFYHRCAQSDKALAPVRVLCLRNLRYWTKKQPDVRPMDSSDYPEEIWELADKLPPVLN